MQPAQNASYSIAPRTLLDKRCKPAADASGMRADRHSPPQYACPGMTASFARHKTFCHANGRRRLRRSQAAQNTKMHAAIKRYKIFILSLFGDLRKNRAFLPA
jgi:hypothetical protein